MKIRLLVLDVDGTLTDGTIVYGSQGIELKAFNVKDGAVIKVLPGLGIDVVFLTGRTSDAVARRARELGAVAVQGIDDKLPALEKILEERGIGFGECAYVGDDLNDYGAMVKCGFKACPADAVQEIREICDYVSFQIGGHGAVRDICENLLQALGKNYEFISNYDFVSTIDDFTEHLSLVDPLTLLNPFRLDILVRYLLFMDMDIEDKDNHKHPEKLYTSLYSRMVLARTAAYAGNKKCLEDFLQKAKELFYSIKENGFSKKHYVRVGINKGLIDGAHRTAASMVLKEKIWVMHENENGKIDFGIDQFKQYGFSAFDIMTILRCYADLKRNCSIYVLFIEGINKWSYIYEEISKRVSVAGWYDIDYTDNYIAFLNLINDLARADLSYNPDMSSLNSMLLPPKLLVRVLLVSQKEGCEHNIHDVCACAENEFTRAFGDTTKMNTDLVYLGSKSVHSYEAYKKILLSCNNITHLKQRISHTYRPSFMKRLNQLALLLKSLEIDIDSICIVGISVLEVMGIQIIEQYCMEVVVLDNVNCIIGEKYQNELTNLTIHSRDYVHNRKTGDIVVNNELLIADHRHHFIFYGFKFANLDYVETVLKHSPEQKEKNTALLISLYRNFIRCFNDTEQRTEIFRKQLLSLQRRLKKEYAIKEDLCKQVKALKSSRSWKLTSPLRKLSKIAKSILRKAKP